MTNYDCVYTRSSVGEKLRSLITKWRDTQVCHILMQYPAQTGDIHAGDIAKDSKVEDGNYCLSVSGMIYYCSSLENLI